jgi:hypothetical protein
MVSVPVVTSSGSPVFTSHYLTLHNFHRDVVSEFTLDIQATVSEFDPKTWGFLMYPNRSSDNSPDFDILVWQILKDGILPLVQHYFQGYFSTVALHIRLLLTFLGLGQGIVANFAKRWRLTERLIRI